MAQTRLSYGPHPRQTLQLFKAKGASPTPLVVMVGDSERTSSLNAHAQRLAALGMTAAVIDRRPARHGFSAHQADVVRAIAALRDDQELIGPLALWGQDGGADTVLLMLRDRRYLASIDMTTDQIMGAVLVAHRQPSEPTFTQSSAYGLNDPPAIYRTTQARAADGIRFLSGLL